MSKIRNIFSVLALGVMLSLGFTALAPAQPTFACGGDPGFFEIPTWHEYLPCAPDGSVDLNLADDLTNLNQLWLIGVGILDIILRLAGLVAFAFVIWGGFGYISSQGQPDKAANARKTIINALIGMVIVIMSTIAVQFAVNLLGGGGVTTQPGGIIVPNPATNGGTIGRVLNFVYALAGAIAVINIVVAGIKLSLSGGDSSKAAGARNTVIYASVGLVIVLSASVITSFILNEI